MENKIILGDCLEVLRGLPDNSVDSVVTDPPYGLAFMGKKWDYNVPSVEIWQEVLRVLKPGGHALVACGTRTQHRMAVNLEDAGFEIRDIVAWVYGSGFPKSLNVAKQVDKLQGNEREVVGKENIDIGMQGGSMHSGRSVQVVERDLTRGTSEWEGYGTALKPSVEAWTLCRKPHKTFQGGSDFDNLFISLCDKIKSELCQYPLFATIVERSLWLSQSESKEDASTAQWTAEKNISIQVGLSVLMDTLRLGSEKNTNLNIVLSWLNTLVEICEAMNMFTTEMKLSLITDLKILNLLEWESIFQSIMLQNETNQNGLNVPACDAQSLFSVLLLKLKDISTHIVQENALSVQLDPKTAMELWTLCRKPLSEKNVAENCLKWGVGGINIDACRVPVNPNIDDMKREVYRGERSVESDWAKNSGFKNETNKFTGVPESGRFPANLIHDGSDEVVGLFPESKGQCGAISGHKNDRQSKNGIYGKYPPANDFPIRNDSGSASRFFYCAKASKSERGEGNNHPTVKPVKLMKYLITLITPKNGIVLEPFGGSGTTAVGCLETGSPFIIIEREPEYIEIIKKRVQAHRAEPDLFNQL